MRTARPRAADAPGLVAINTYTEARAFAPPTNGGAILQRDPKPAATPKKKADSTFRVDRFGDLDSL